MRKSNTLKSYIDECIISNNAVGVYQNVHLNPAYFSKAVSSAGSMSISLAFPLTFSPALMRPLRNSSILMSGIKSLIQSVSGRPLLNSSYCLARVAPPPRAPPSSRYLKMLNYCNELFIKENMCSSKFPKTVTKKTN